MTTDDAAPDATAPTDGATDAAADGDAPGDGGAAAAGPAVTGADRDATADGDAAGTPDGDEAGGSFADLGLRSEVLATLDDLGYEEPTPIQREAIPPLVQGRDLLGQAATGTGKTAAFALPILERLPAGDRGPEPTALVLVPTRELAVQVSEAVHRYGRALGARVLPIYGGQPIVRQLRALQAGVDVVVATPGRALDHIGRGTLVLDHLEVVVLDEADEMLDMGFAEDIEAILQGTPEGRQTVLFSATMPPRIDGLARSHQRDPVRIRIGQERTAPGQAPRVRQHAYVVARAHKPAALSRVLDVESPDAALVFCRTRTEVDQLTEILNGRGYRAEALHGGMSQEQRDRVMGRLRSGTADLLIATDVAARGLDVEQLTHVVNYDVPSAPESYVHRIGRVGRAGREGVAITLAEPREHRMLKNIERVTGQRIAVEKVPTVADLRARRLELTRAALQEVLLEDDLERFRVVVETLTDEFDVMEVALAAVKLAHEAGGAAADEAEIPEASPPPSRDTRGRDDRSGPAGRGGRPGTGRGKGPNQGMTRLFVGAGRAAGIRPGDLVGAIAGETSLQGRDIGAIEIAERFSLVEVPQAAAGEVITALRGTTIKGRKATVRREREQSR
jgi:ATP-dependent RNA helicase DeaD